ncbi:MAG: transglycosylase domain-containing protein [Anaerolineae bacterium]
MSITPAQRILLERRLARLRARKSRLGMLVTAIVAVPAAGLLAGVVGALVGYAMLSGELRENLSHIQNLEGRRTFETTSILDRHGVLLRQVIGEGRRTYVPLAKMSPYVVKGTVAVEDETFATNPGIDVEGIARAVIGEARALGQRVLGDSEATSSGGGGSTITQQFVRHVAFTDEERLARSYKRKAKELILAVMLTREYSKDQILEWYLNEIYYGNLAYGIEAAAQTVFDKSAVELNLAEAAVLIGLPQAPRYYDPLNPDPEFAKRVKDRQRIVLNLMAERRVITAAEAEAAYKSPLHFRKVDEDRFEAPHFVVYVEKFLEDLPEVGPARLARGGLNVTTTLDLSTQRMAQAEVSEQVAKLVKAQHLTNGAVVAMEPRTGQVLAMVGSADYWDDAIDGRVNVAVRERQPGSSIKPLTFVTAIANGMSPATMIWDVPWKLYPNGQLYEPKNYDDTFHGPVRLRTALANSYNIPALKVLNSITPNPDHKDDAGKAGVELTVETAHKMGITGLQRDPWSYGLSLTLGGGEVTLLDLTTAYGTLANAGELVRPHTVLTITDSAGKLLYSLKNDAKALKPEPAVDPGAAFIVTDFLADNNARAPAFGTNSPLNLGVPAAAKTGTTNDYRDNWTLGFTPSLVVGVWAGNSDNTAMKHSSGVTGAAPIWRAVMRGILFDDDRKAMLRSARAMFDLPWRSKFEEPDNVVQRSVCNIVSLNNLGTACREYRNEYFLKNFVAGGSASGAGDTAGDAAAPAAAPPPDVAALGVGGTPVAAAAGGDVWATMGAVVAPQGSPPPEVVAAAEAEKKPVKWAPASLCAPDAVTGFGADKVQGVAVLPLPADEQERTGAIAWARSNGWAALEPSEVCSQALLDAALAPGSLPGPNVPISGTVGITGTYRTAYSQSVYHLNVIAGTTLSSRTVLTGTATFNPSEIEYFKVELSRRDVVPAEWITLGQTHTSGVVDGPLEVLDAASLAPGDYTVRLVLVKKDGNFLDPPYSVPIRIGPAP